MRRGGSPTARAALRAWSGNQQALLTEPILIDTTYYISHKDNQLNI
jgi:hypothetical protein